MKFYIETYGCQMNVYDSKVCGDRLSGDGHTQTEGLDDADVILLNTCAIRERAEERVFGRLGELSSLKYTRPDIIMGVLGCMGQRLGEQIVERAPYVDLVVGTGAYERLPELVRMVREDRKSRVDLESVSETLYSLEDAHNEGQSVFVSISQGCDRNCTFCIVPSVRGPQRCRSIDSIVHEVRSLVAAGTREVTLLGQIVNAYDHDGADFADLLRAVDGVDGLLRLRYTSPHPLHLTPRVIEAMAECGTVCEFLHLPVQSGSDRMLKLMGRQHSRAHYLDVVRDLRAAIPDLGLSTDVITGFPGETEEEFQETLSLCEEARFDSAFMFAYSPREGTAAPRLPDPVPEEVRLERLERLIGRMNRQTEESLRNVVGSRASVLFEGPSRKDPSLHLGRTRQNVRLVAAAEDAPSGREIDLEVMSLRGRTLVGAPCLTNSKEVA